MFLFFAYSITLMHTLVPHQHEQEMVKATTAVVQLKSPGCTSLVSFFQFLFAADLGSNHLEKFKKGAPEPLDLSFAPFLLYSAITALLLSPFLTTSPKPLSNYTEKLRQQLLLAGCKPLRAPPAFA